MSSRDDAEDAPGRMRDDVHLASTVEPERRGAAQSSDGPLPFIGHLAVHILEALQPAVAVIGIEIVTVYRRDLPPAIDESAGDAALAAAVRVSERGKLQSGAIAVGAAQTRRALHDAPSVVDAGAICGNDVDFLETILSDVGDVQVSVLCIERVTPRVTETDRPDLPATAAVRIRIRRRHRVRIDAIDVDAKELSEK